MADQKRQVALKVRIKDLLEGRYVKEEGWEPNFIKLPDNRKCSRTNIMGVIISKTDTGDSCTIDDGSDSILVRSFETTTLFDGVSIGDVVMLIGRPREYQDNKYIVPEILRKVTDQKWVQVRKRELELIEKDNPRVNEPAKPVEPPKAVEEKKAEPVQEEPEEKKDELPKDPHQEVIDLIRQLDRGDGADIEELTSTAKVGNADQIIEALLREGEIFELKPGKLKVLE